jgi:hypothetical protein
VQWSCTSAPGNNTTSRKPPDVWETFSWTALQACRSTREEVGLVCLFVCKVCNFVCFCAAAMFYLQGAEWGDCDSMVNLACCFDQGADLAVLFGLFVVFLFCFLFLLFELFD